MKYRFLVLTFLIACQVAAQVPVSVGHGSYASFVPLRESKSSMHGGCQAYAMEHRTIYIPDSLAGRPLPSNDWWTYALVNPWTGKIWQYPGWVEAKASGIEIGYPTYWEPTGCEMKWDAPLTITFPTSFTPACALVDAWSDMAMSFVEQSGNDWVRTTCMHGSPLVWLECEGVMPFINNPDPNKYAVYQTSIGTRRYVAVGLLTDGLTYADLLPYAFRIPRHTTIAYDYLPATSTLSTSFHLDYEDIIPSSASGMLMGLLPHHYQGTTLTATTLTARYATPRGEMRMAVGNDFTIAYPVNAMLPFFPAPLEWKSGFNASRMQALNNDYARRGTFGADTYWGGKGLTQMMHYMTFALQMGDTATFRLSKQRLKDMLIDWYTYTPGEDNRYFAYYPRWGAMVGFDPSYDSDTFNDHHFHYGYFVYASAVLCMLDDEFREQYGPMAREVARDYANWKRTSTPGEPAQPWMRTLDPYCGHSFAGGMGNGGNGNGQESTSEAMQGWGGVWMLGAALGDDDMLRAGIFGYTLESRATAEYWFDRGRRNIDYTKYLHPYCCNLTMQGVGWWTWFSGDPVWMHSIQWLPISPVLTNYLGEDLTFARWDYTEMYAHKEIGNYEAATGGLGDESGLGNVCLSYLSLFEPDSALRVWNRMDAMGKALAKNPDTGGITYWLANMRRSLGNKVYDVRADYPLATAYVDSSTGDTTFAVFNAGNTARDVHYTYGRTIHAAPHALTMQKGSQVQTIGTIADEPKQDTDTLRPDYPCAFPNIALHKPVTASSSENAGTVATYATDGDIKTRWGSTHHDGEWMQVDLGVNCYIDYIVVRWEAAYASSYLLAVSEDGTAWTSVEAAGTNGAVSTPIHARGRYIRLTGVERATTYGISLYELEAYGIPLSGDQTALFALTIETPDEYLFTGQTPVYAVRGYSLAGTEVAITPVITTEQSETLYTVKAVQGNLQAIHTWPILEALQIDTLIVSPDHVRLAVGQSQVFTVSACDQFGYVADSYQSTFTATHEGDTILQFVSPLVADIASAYVSVVPYASLNLATGKVATASGSENDATGADKAVDGDLTTRWSSRFQDNEWLQIDLGDCFVIDSVVLSWEAAYATEYQVQVSEDGAAWEVVHTRTGANGGKQSVVFAPRSAHYVRVVCQKRNTGYGASLWEVEIYGIGLCDRSTDLHDSSATTDESASAIKRLENNRLLILRSGHTYDALGRKAKF